MTNISIKITDTGIALNLASVIGDSIALLISISLFCFIVYRLLQRKIHHVRTPLDVPVILSINSLILIIIKNFLQSFHITLPTLGQDFQLVAEEKDSIACRIRGYFFFVVITALYLSYALLAVFRFARVVHPKHVWLHRPTVYLYVFIPAQFAFALFSILLAIFIYDAIHLIPGEAYCSSPLDQLDTMIYMSIITFGLPMGALSASYVCIVWKMRHSSPVRRFRQRNQRDYVVIRRIMMIITILSIVALPSTVGLIVYTRPGSLDPLVYRIQWLTSSVGSIVFAGSLPFITPQLWELLRKKKSSRLRF